MSPHRDLDPLEVLSSLTKRLYPCRPRHFPVDEAPPGFLAAPVDSVPAGMADPSGTDPRPRAVRNGYALSREIGPGTTCRLLGILAPTRTLGADGQPLPEDAGARGDPDPDDEADPEAEGGTDEPRVWRVETGALLPPGTSQVLPLELAVIVGSCRIRIDGSVPPGDGICSPSQAEGGLLPAPVKFPAGWRFDARLRSALLARGVSSIDLRPPFPVGFATVGDELIDLGAPAGDDHRADLVALAIEDSLKSLRLVPLPFGILTDSPDDIRDVSYRARERRVEVLILAGGLGDGVTDRVLESLRRLDAEILLEGRTFGPGSGIFHAKIHDYDVIGISGMPLLAAAQIDLFVVPALLARLGAAPAYWDWSRVLWKLDAPAALHGARIGGGSPVGVDGGFTVLPCHVVTSRGGPPSLVARVPESPFLPLAAGEEGWAVIPPGPPGEPASERKAYFQPCRA